MTPHINAKDGAFAKTVLMPGDPLRAKLLADTFLENAELVTDVRNIYGYTGTYKGVPVSVMASGMGMPSIGIYSWELFSFYGVENIIRIGSAGSYSAQLDVLDVVLAKEAYSESSFAKTQGGYDKDKILPGKHINDVIIQAAKDANIECKLARVHSSDVFYSNDAWQNIHERTKCDCVEMEAFALFHNANVLGKNAACLLTISDSFVSKRELTSDERQNSFKNMMTVALEAAIKL
jgi:purine-nucleoside phosphorylase